MDVRPNRRNKAAFSWRISVDGRPNRRNLAERELHEKLIGE